MGRLIPLSPGLELEQAEKLRRSNVSTDFERAWLLESEVNNLKTPETKFILKGLISEKSINLINGFRGMGKSWYTTSIANEVTWGGCIGPWDVEESVNTVIVDGEMPMSLIQDRLRLLNIGRPDVRKKPSLLFIYAESFAYRIGLKRANLLDAKWRESISESCLRNHIGLIILDNLSSLAPGIDENAKLEFDPINRWMLELRFHGIAIILTHHVGKSGDQRGTTAHEDHLDTSLLLTRPSGYKRSDGCKFKVEITKDRSYHSEGNQFTLQLCQTEAGNLEFATCATATLDEVCRMINDDPDLSQKDAQKLGIHPMTFQRARVKLGLKKRKYEKSADSNLQSGDIIE